MLALGLTGEEVVAPLTGPFCLPVSQQWEVGTSREMQVLGVASIKSLGGRPKGMSRSQVT